MCVIVCVVCIVCESGRYGEQINVEKKQRIPLLYSLTFVHILIFPQEDLPNFPKSSQQDMVSNLV